MNIGTVKDADIYEEWDRVKEHIGNALVYNGNSHSLDDIFAGFKTGRFQLWTGDESAMVTELETYPNFKTCRIFLAGGEMDELKNMEGHVSNWASSIGCNKMEIAGRIGWERTLKDKNYKKQFVLLTRSLDEW